MYYAITEWKMDTTASALPIHIYQFSVSNLEERHQENGKIAFQLRQQNGYQPVSFFGSMVASFEELTNWGTVPAALSHEHRPVQLSHDGERTLLQRLLMQQLQNGRGIKGYGGLFIYDRDQKECQDVIVKRAIKLDASVQENGSIVFGFELKHKFFRKDNIYQRIRQNTLPEGASVVDKYNKRYTFSRTDTRSISDPLSEIGQSLLSYYQSRGRGNEVSHLPADTPIVEVQNNGTPIFYPPQLLFEECSFAQLSPRTTQEVTRFIKLTAHKKMELSIELAGTILKQSPSLTFSKRGLLAETHGYKPQILSAPTLLFGENKKLANPFSGLRNGRLYSSHLMEKIQVHFFMDQQIVQSVKDKDPVGNKVLTFIQELKTLSQKLGVPIEIENRSKHVKDYTTVSFNDPKEFRLKLRSIASELIFPTVVITTKDQADACYEIIKKECSRKEIPTQVITLDTLDIKEGGKLYSQLNVLLGIYAKSGVQPWILSNPLRSDCFIGLDVSHENGRHSTGIVQIIGKDGRVLDSGPMSSSEAGEVIRKDTLEEIVLNAISSFEKEFQSRPAHLTFHRDGKGHQSEIADLTAILKEYDIAFDYVSVIKNTDRRMATFEETSKEWKTEMGMAYQRGNTAYLLSTNPPARVGMAKPIKITALSGSTPLDHLVQDIYFLSHMHIGALNKSRLPITTHYADLSSTFYNRGLLPGTHTKKSLHFI